MQRPSIEKTNEDAKNALRAFEKADEYFKGEIKRYIYMGPITLGKTMPKPEALLNYVALQEIDEAWHRVEYAEGQLHDAYVQLSLAHHNYFVEEGQVGKGKCPKCGSYEVSVVISKPPSFLCKKCGYEFT